MKKIKNKYHLLVGSLLTTLLGFFGVSCGGQELLYGSPHAEYNVKGEVTDEDGEALESMQVSLKVEDEFTWPKNVYTNEQGMYNMQIMLNSFGGECLEVIVNDTTGEYESDTLHIPPKKMHLVEQTDWTVKYAVDADFQLHKKSNQPASEYVFEKLTLSDEDKAALDQIFSESNQKISNYARPLMEHDDCEKCREGKHKDEAEHSNDHAIVEVIGSKKELSAICPKGVNLPNLDFNNCCIVWAGVETASSGNTFTAADLEELGDGNYMFHCTIKIKSLNCAIGEVYPYAVYSFSKEYIKQIEKDIRFDYR